jgi:hypothetical protein
MNDTTHEIEIRFREMMMKKSGQERMKMGFSMFNMARSQIVASIKTNNPDADIREIRKEVFLRFYGMEFSPEEKKKILTKIL